MASLQYSCSVLATHSRPSFKPFSTKPSHLLTDARRSHRFQVSCNGGANQKPPAEGKVDRRNMLLGLGGLYGAANLVVDSQAYADPVKPPDFNACGTAHVDKDPLDVNCCPPVSVPQDYTIPAVTKLRLRPAAHKVSKEYIAKYEEAIRLMKALDKDDPTDPRGFTQQANVHCAYCNGAHDQVGYQDLDFMVHYSWLFFPFHRWYLYFYERILGKLIDDPTFALPYWNWDNPKGMQMPRMFDNSRSPLYDENRNQTNRPPNIVDLGFPTTSTDITTRIANNLSIMHTEMISSVNSTLDFMGQPYCAGSSPNPGGGTSENGSHTAVHAWVGDPRNEPYHEDLGNFYSAGRDPLFYCHHANVDRMWTIWRTELKIDVPRDITKTDYLNATFLFYDENKNLVRVKAGDCTDNTKLGYDYEKMPILWVDYKPVKKKVKADTQKLASGAQKAEGLFPLTLTKTTKVLVPKSAKGKADEVLVLENIETDTTKFIKFDVFVNDEDDNAEELDKAEYAGTFAQVPHKTKDKKGKSTISLRLTELYEDIDVADDDTIVVTLIPRSNGDDVTIGGIKIIPSPPRSG